MTPTELLTRIEACGGTLILRGDKIRYRIPAEAADLVQEIRAQRDAVIEVLRRRQVGFCCDRCGAHFDTGIGRDWHVFNSCQDVPRPPARLTPLPSCPTCGSYGLFRQKSGAVTCETCKSSNKATDGGRDRR